MIHGLVDKVREKNTTATTATTATVSFSANANIVEGKNDTSEFRHDHKTTKILMWLIRELCKRLPDTKNLVEMLYDRHQKEVQLETDDLEKTMIEMLYKTDKTSIFVDAIDECNPNHILEFLRSLKRIQSETKVGLVITTRSWDNSYRQMFPIAKTWELAAHINDIESYIEIRWEAVLHGWKGSKNLYENVVSCIQRSSGGM